MNLLRILDDKPAPSIADAKTLGASGNTSGDYWLPTTMCLYQKELTDQIVSLHYSDILRYFETSDFKEDVVLESMKTMCQNSAMVATHPFLLIDHFLPKSLISRDIPSHLCETSGKFTVLRDLVTLVQDYETDTALVCRPGRTMDLVEALLLGNKVDIKRYDSNSVKSRQKKQKKVSHPCTVHIFPSKDWDTKKHPIDKKVARFDMFIALDHTVNTNNKDMISILTHGRRKKLKGDRTMAIDMQTPIVRLVVINSFEHCDLFFREKYGENTREYLESVTAAVVVLRDRVGVLPPDLRPIYNQHLGYLTEWIDDPSLPWPLPDIYTIKHYTSMDVERSLLSEVNYTPNDDLDSAFTNNNKKRSRASRPQLNNLKESSVDSNDMSNSKVPSFYESKRLKNDYSKNPTKQTKGILTGIIGNHDSSSSNYHLSSEILTHRLIQSMAQVYHDLETQKKEIQMYHDLDPIEELHVKFYSKEDMEMKEKASKCDDIIESNRNRYQDIERENKSFYHDTEALQKQYDSILESFAQKGELMSKLKDLILKKYDLEEIIEKETKKSESKDVESEYMKKEITRARNSIQDSLENINKLSIVCQKIEDDLKTVSNDFCIKTDQVNEEIIHLKQSYAEEKQLSKTLEEKLETLTKRLQQIPVQRIRASQQASNPSRKR